MVSNRSWTTRIGWVPMIIMILIWFFRCSMLVVELHWCAFSFAFLTMILFVILISVWQVMTKCVIFTSCIGHTVAKDWIWNSVSRPGHHCPDGPGNWIAFQKKMLLLFETTSLFCFPFFFQISSIVRFSFLLFFLCVKKKGMLFIHFSIFVSIFVFASPVACDYYTICCQYMVWLNEF